VFLRGHWNTADFVTNYLPLAFFPVLYVAARFWTRVPHVKPSEMDFYTGLAEIEASTYDEPPPKNKVEALWQWLVSAQSMLFISRSVHCLPNRCEWWVVRNR